MAQGSRPERVGEEIREELGVILAREVHDPGIGFVTLTRVKVSPDLQLVRVFYTLLGDDKARRETQKALERATPFMRRQIGARVRLRRVPELRFEFDEGIAHQERVEKILFDLAEERRQREAAQSGGDTGETRGQNETEAAGDPEGPALPEKADKDPA
jgi:ribosome-binding factor A